MAPRKRKAEESKEMTTRVTRGSTRMTRSSAKQLNARPTALPTESTSKKNKRGKAAAAEKKKKETTVEVKTEPVTKITESETEAKAAKAESFGEAEAENDEAEEKEAKEAEDKEITGGDAPNKTIVIEYCKQCKSFKDRAVQVQNGLKNAVPGIEVLLNPDKPRKGCFEIREEGGRMFISLLDMKRPFKPMKDLNMDKVISDIIDRVND